MAGQSEGFDLDVATPIVKACIDRLRHIWGNFPDADADDIYQEAIVALQAAHGTYDPARAKYTTFVNRVVGCDIRDLAKRATRRRNRETRAAGERKAVGVEDDGDLVGWLRDTYEGIVGMVRLPARVGPAPRGPGGRPKTYTTHQVLAIVALQRRQCWSNRRVEMELTLRADLRDAIGLSRAPSEYAVRTQKKCAMKLKNCLCGVGGE